MALKFVPVMVTLLPTIPDAGEKEVMVGTVGAPTVKLVPLVAVLHPTITEIVPVVAPAGTLVVMVVDVLAVTTAAVPLNLTMLLAGTGSKLVPVMVTGVPTGPLVGAKEVMVGSSDETVLRNTDTVLVPPEFAVARSALPSPSKSPMETD